MRTKRLNTSLLIETAIVTIFAILVIRVFGIVSVSKKTWFLAPGILIAAALAPTAITKREFAGIGFDGKQISHSLVLLGLWAVVDEILGTGITTAVGDAAGTRLV